LRIDPVTSARVNNASTPTSARAVNVAPSVPCSPTDAPASWTSVDIEAFRVFAEANRRTESGGVATFSSLRTTAGPDYRASFGVAQLSVREHLARLARTSDATLESLGTTRAEVESMRGRGEAMAAFYHLLVDRRDVARSASQLDLDADTQAWVRVLVEARDVDRLRVLLGERFAVTTGVSPDAIETLVQTRTLRDEALREAFGHRYAHDHGASFDPMHRDASRMATTARHLALAHPELSSLASALGGDDAAFASIGHYLGVGDSAENLLGWHARAAASAVGDERMHALLASVDTTTSHAREIENFERSLAAVARVRDLSGEERVATLARIGRMFHGAPTRVREALFVDGRLDAPRCTSRAELDALLDRLREGRRWSDERLARRVADVIDERRRS
jgi:hypothetical protein